MLKYFVAWLIFLGLENASSLTSPFQKLNLPVNRLNINTLLYESIINENAAQSNPDWTSCFRRKTKLSVAVGHSEIQESAISELPKTPRYGPHLTIKGYALNFIGLLYIFMSFGAAFFFYPFLLGAYVVSKIFQPKTMRSVDWVVHMWSKASCLLMTYKPKITGTENLPPRGEAVMYIPNHCSYFDIMTLSGFLPRPFKYISKIEVLRIPLIGWAMRMAHHIAIRRADRKSQLQTFKDAVNSLKDGNSIVTFAEGTRSPDGRLGTFKKGPFTMAKRAGIRIVPISLVNTHLMMPKDCLMPVGVPRNIEIVLHSPISTEGKTEEELLELVRNAVASGLPAWQQAPKQIESTPVKVDE